MSGTNPLNVNASEYGPSLNDIFGRAFGQTVNAAFGQTTTVHCDQCSKHMYEIQSYSIALATANARILDAKSRLADAKTSQEAIEDENTLLKREVARLVEQNQHMFYFIQGRIDAASKNLYDIRDRLSNMPRGPVARPTDQI